MNEGRGFSGLRIEDDVVCTATGVEVLTGSRGKMLALFESPRWLDRLVEQHPDWVLDSIRTGLMD